VLNTVTWVKRLQLLAPVSSLSYELIRFDLQKMENPEISGVEYQQGTLYGYELKGYLLAKWKHTCAYCGAKDVPLEIEHVVPKANGGTDRVSNLTVSCRECNQKKGTQDIRAFFSGNPARLSEVLSQLKGPLKDAAAVNSTRWRLFEELMETGLPIETGSGGRTKFNRTTQGYRKDHWIDAACVGETGADIDIDGVNPLRAKSSGHGCRRMCLMDEFGFPRSGAKTTDPVHGFQTGDRVKAIVPKGKKAGTHIGRVAIRKSGYFDITTPGGKVEGISYRYCRHLYIADGYNYHFERRSARAAA